MRIWWWYVEVGVWNWGVELERTYFSGTIRAAARLAVGCCTTRVEKVMMIGENAELCG